MPKIITYGTEENNVLKRPFFMSNPQVSFKNIILNFIFKARYKQNYIGILHENLIVDILAYQE